MRFEDRQKEASTPGFRCKLSSHQSVKHKLLSPDTGINVWKKNIMKWLLFYKYNLAIQK